MKKVVLISVLGAIVVIIFAGFLIFSYNKIFYPLKYEEEIVSVSKEFNVSPEIIASIINVESRFNEKVVSNKGAVGLMQILPSTASWTVQQLSGGKGAKNSELELSFYNETTKEGELFDPMTNIRIGTCYFVYLLNKFGDFDVALCAYNAGEGVVRNWLGKSEYSNNGKTLSKIPYSETKNYVEKVNRNIKVYSKKFK